MEDDRRSQVRRTPLGQSKSKPVVTPIYPSVMYSSPTPDDLDDLYEGRAEGYAYAREGHPNATVLADKIDCMEGVSGGIITGSGMAALATVFLGLLEKGDHILAGNQLYGRSMRLLNHDLPRMGFSAGLADPTDVNAFKKALKANTKIILLEVVSNPTLRIAEFEAIADLARESGALLVVDNTFTTPRGFQPFQNGADIVFHSVTKLLAGHADVTLGYVAAKDAELQLKIRDAATTWGMTPSPNDCWLAERGLYSFDLRYERSQENAAALADHIAGLPGVLSVIYPGRPDHPDHNRATRILGHNFGNMLSLRLEGGRAAVNRFLKAAPDIAFAPTLGDIGTILSHPPSSSHRGLTPEQREALGICEGFLRVSVGVEDIVQLKREFSAAIAAAGRSD